MSEMEISLLGEEGDNLVSLDFFERIRPARKSYIERYLADMSVNDQDAASMMAKDIKLSNKALARTVALVPVASHQEAGTIANAVRQYAKQDADEPFSVVLFPNMPFEGSQEEADKTLDEIRKAAVAHPQLDLRWHANEMHEESSIGAIRRKLWNAALLLAYTEGGFDDNDEPEILGLNHDIDVVSMSPQYINRIQAHRRKLTKRYQSLDIGNLHMPVLGTAMSHAPDMRYPHSSQATLWFDFTHRQIKDISSYEASFVIPFVRYAENGGFSADAKTHETEGFSCLYQIPRTTITTSPRRFITRLQETGLDTVWSDDTFGSNDTCRTNDLGCDISQDRKEELIFDSLETRMDYMFHKSFRRARILSGVQRDLSDNEKIAILARDLKKRKKLAMTTLDRFVNAPVSASVIDLSYDPEAMAKRYYQ